MNRGTVREKNSMIVHNYLLSKPFTLINGGVFVRSQNRETHKIIQIKKDGQEYWSQSTEYNDGRAALRIINFSNLLGN